MKSALFAITLCLATPALSNEVALSMADGAPWQMQDPTNRTAQLTLQPDGTGRVKAGLMGAKATWEATEDGLCLTTRPLGTTCLALVRTSEGVTGRAEDGGVFVFAR